MKKQLFLSVMLLALPMVMFTVRVPVGSRTAAPTNRGASGPSQNVPYVPSSSASNAGSNSGSVSNAAAQTIANHPGHEIDVLAGALETVGQTLAGYTVPTSTSSDTLAYDGYMGGKQFASTGKVS